MTDRFAARVAQLCLARTIAAALVLTTSAAAIAATDAPANAAAPAANPVRQEQTGITVCIGDDCTSTDTAADGEVVKPKPKIKPLSEFVEDKTRIDGLIPLYRDDETGVVYMELSPQQFETQFIYHAFVESGMTGLISQLTDLSFAGRIQENYVVTFRRSFNRVDIIQRSLEYVVDEGSPLERALAINNSDSVMARMNIVAEDEDDGRVLVAANALFVGDDLLSIGNNASPLAGILGINATLSKSKTSILRAENFPENTAVTAEYVFDFKRAIRPVSVVIRHNFTPLPQSDYVPRADDARVGFFTVRRTNLSVMGRAPFEDKIKRWALRKTDPSAELSPVDQPITFWLQNSTPLEYRAVLRDAILQWNNAFRAAGFLDPVVVDVQPDDATWRAGDMRYNVIQWITSPNPSFNGFGPTVVDPRTGEIIAADVVLEQNSVSRQLLLNAVFPGISAELDEAGEAQTAHDHTDAECGVAELVGSRIALASLAVQAELVDDPVAAERELERIVREGLMYLAMHEVGHVLGLTHNMKASYFRSVEELQGGLPEGAPITGSVMDYPAINLLPDRAPGAHYFPTMLGPYDEWAIGYGYDSRMDDADYREAFLARAGSAGYLYGNDAEDMRGSGRGIDPRVQPYDHSSNPVQFAALQMDYIAQVLPELPTSYAQRGLSNDDLLRAHSLMLSTYARNAAIISRYIGGIYTARDVAPLNNPAVLPLVPVDEATQRAAMAVLSERVFAPGVLDLPPSYFAQLVPVRRGMSGLNLPDHPNDVWRIQSGVINHLLHPDTLERLLASEAIGGTYTPSAMLGDLDQAIFAADMNGAVDSYRRNLQLRYVTQLIGLYGTGNANLLPVRPEVLAALRTIERQMRRAANRGDAQSKAHRLYIIDMIQTALDEKAG